MKEGKYDLPLSIPGSSAPANPPGRLNHATAFHQAEVVGSNGQTPLRRNVGKIALRDLASYHQTPNVKARLEMYRAAETFQIAGLRDKAITGLREVVEEFRGHPAVDEVLKEKLPFAL